MLRPSARKGDEAPQPQEKWPLFLARKRFGKLARKPEHETVRGSYARLAWSQLKPHVVCSAARRISIYIVKHAQLGGMAYRASLYVLNSTVFMAFLCSSHFRAEMAKSTHH